MNKRTINKVVIFLSFEEVKCLKAAYKLLNQKNMEKMRKQEKTLCILHTIIKKWNEKIGQIND